MKKINVILITGFLLLSGLVINPAYGKDSISAPNEKNIFYVGGNGTGNYTHIQDAIDDASSGDIVFVYSGVYNENLLFSNGKSLELIGQEVNSTFINGTNSNNVVSIYADRVKINGFTLTNSGQYNNGIYINSNNNVICGNFIFNNDNGIEIYSSKNTIIYNNFIAYNDAWGIYLWPDADNIKIIGNTISDNEGPGVQTNSGSNNIFMKNNIVSNNNDHGICIGGTSNSSGHNILQNTIINNQGIGLFISLVTNSNFYGNTVSDNLYYGIAIFESNNIKLSFNDVSYNSMSGAIIMKLTNSKISNNEFSCNEDGIIIERSQGNVISENEIACNALYGIKSTSNSSNNHIYHNNIINNTINGFDEGNNSWDNGYPSGGNYWSDYKGVDNNGDGIGDTPYIISSNSKSLTKSNSDNYPFMSYNGWEKKLLKTLR